MNYFFENINKNEILKYLGYRTGEVPADIMEEIDEAISIVKKCARPKYVFRFFDIDDEVLKEIAVGRDMAELLRSSFKVILFAVTLGNEIEMEIRKLSFTNLSMSVVVDATASAAIEAFAEELDKSFQKEFSGFYLTDRFSPGYGDMPISIQNYFLTAINAKKEIGITTTVEGIMTPRKSITAIMGVSKEVQPHRHRGCENCRLFRNCEFRKRGENCGYEG